MDADYARNKRADGSAFADYEHALFVYATVMSVPVPERAIVDAGLKAFAVDSGMPLPWKPARAPSTCAPPTSMAFSILPAGRNARGAATRCC